MTKPLVHSFEETGNNKEVAVDAPLPGTANRRVFARGPIRRHITQNEQAWPVYDWLMLQDGRWFSFSRIANMAKAGVVDLEQVAIESEVIIFPGLIYRRGIPLPAELLKWRQAQDKIEAKLAGKYKGTDTAATNSKLLKSR
jgi:hypothetical protein